MSSPYRAFRFVVEIDGLESAGFMQVTGLQRETTFEEYREGGLNDYVHKLVTVTKFPSLSLKRGVTSKTDLWDWHQEVVAGDIRRKAMAILLLDEAGETAWRWTVDAAFPVKWSGADLDSANNTVAAETVELVHRGIRRQ
jgi:phage tail-like protein